MRTPFTEFEVSDPLVLPSEETPFEIESPLLDPAAMGFESSQEEPKAFLNETLAREDNETAVIDIEKAVRLNKKYGAELWGKQVAAILKYFSSIGIKEEATPVDAKQFSLMVAKWQDTVFRNEKSTDGILGPNSWALLKPLITSVTAPVPVLTPSRWHGIIKNTVPCSAVPLVHGKETFEHIVNAIRTAGNSEHYIYILGWMLDVDFEMIPGDKSSTLIRLLQDASSKGVEIRLMVWDNPIYINEINVAAGKINALSNSLLIKDNATFGSPRLKSAIATIRLLLSQAPYFLRFINSWNSFTAKVKAIQNEGSHHEKVVVVKGREGLIGFCGGIDINPNRISGKDSTGRVYGIDNNGNSIVLHDIHCKVQGHAAWVLLRRFIWRWQVYKSTRQTLNSLLLSKVLRGEKENVPFPVKQGVNTAHVKILQTYNHPNTLIQDRTIREAVRLAIMNAKKTVHIEDQYMISLEIASWLNLKLKEPGFSSVTILTQDDEVAGADILFSKQMRKKFIDQLQTGLSADVIKRKIFINMLHLTLPPTAHHKVHSKIYIIDDDLAIIGSANLSSRSMTHDSETAALIFNDPGSVTNFALQLKAKENADPNTHSIPYSPNPNVKDIDVKIIDELNNLSTAKKIALAATGPALSYLIPQVIKMLLTQLKPAIIDIIDPDADNTQPQQELEGWPEPLNETDPTFYETDVIEEVNPDPDYVITADNEVEGTDLESEDEISGNDDFEQGFLSEDIISDSSEREDSFNPQPEDKQVAEVMEHQVAVVKSAFANPKSCEGHTCWAKNVLNNLLGLNLALNNVLDDAAKKAISDFQLKNNLAQTQKVNAVTERVLLEMDSLRRHIGTPYQLASEKTITEAKSKIEDWTKQAVNNKPQHILDSYRDPRKVYAFVLHQMAFKRKGRQSGQYSDPTGYVSTGAHFCIMLDGRIIQLHPMSRMIWHGNCVSPRSVAVEFEGNFSSIKGTWWYPTDKKTGKKIKINEDKPTQAQFESGRFLVSYLKLVLGTSHILAHRQSSDSRENDPGPDIWYHVGQWAVDKLGLSDGGPSFKCGTGKPILPQWRTWGTIAPQPEIHGYYYEAGDENEVEFSEEQEPQNLIDETPGDESEFNDEEDIGYEAPDFETYTLAYRLSKLNDWAHLLAFKVSDDLVSRLKSRNMYVQYAHNESYSNDLNVDFYRLRIDKFPTLHGVTQNAQSLVKYIRLNINSLVDTSYCDWHPYSLSIDKPIWLSENALGAVLRQDIKGPDNAAVVVSLSKPNGWRFSTVTTPGTGKHPVSGHREFFIGKDPVTGGTYFIIKGLDMMSTGIAGLGLPLAGRWGFGQGDALWKSMREKIILFINSNGGMARSDITYSERIEWRHVYHSYRNLLADTFGKGAGSAQNSSFFSFQLEE